MVELEEEERAVVEMLSKEMVEEVTKIQVLVLNTILELRKENGELKRKLAAEKECKVCEQEMENLDFEIETEKRKGSRASSGFKNLFDSLDSLELDWDKSVKELIDGMAGLPVDNPDQKKKVAFQEKTSEDQDLVDFEVKIKEKLRFTPKKEKAKNSKTESKLEVKVVEETDVFDRMIEKIRNNSKETPAEDITSLEDVKDETSKQTFSGSLEELEDAVRGMMVEDQNGTLSSCFCGVKMTRSVELRNHIEKSHFTSFEISCNLCSKVFRSRKILSVHILRMHGHEFEPQVTSGEEKDEENDTDFQKTINESETFYDEFVNDENLVYFCDQCDHRTDCDESLNNHKMEEHSQASENGKMDTTEKSIEEVVKGDESKTGLKCKECDYEAAAKKNLKKHYRNMHYKTTDVTIDEFNKIFSKQF